VVQELSETFSTPVMLHMVLHTLFHFLEGFLCRIDSFKLLCEARMPSQFSAQKDSIAPLGFLEGARRANIDALPTGDAAVHIQ
jgi:hypothetical protein